MCRARILLKTQFHLNWVCCSYSAFTDINWAFVLVPHLCWTSANFLLLKKTKWSCWLNMKRWSLGSWQKNDAAQWCNWSRCKEAGTVFSNRRCFQAWWNLAFRLSTKAQGLFRHDIWLWLWLMATNNNIMKKKTILYNNFLIIVFIYSEWRKSISFSSLRVKIFLPD